MGVEITLLLVFVSAAVMAALALWGRQSLLIAYVAAGVIVGPEVLNLLPPTVDIAEIGTIGIMFLLFLLGLHLHPQDLGKLFKSASSITFISSLAVLGVVYVIMMSLGYSAKEAVFAGLALSFSSTIIGLKLLPTTSLHHSHTGEVIVSVLLLQDIIAIIMLLVIQAMSSGDVGITSFAPLLWLPVLAVACWQFEQRVLIPLFLKFGTVQEFIFITCLAWCLGIAFLAHMVGLSHEMGAFIAGITLATNRVSDWIAEQLKPLRDFFLVVFFFSLGATFPLGSIGSVIVPALIIAIAVMVTKVFSYDFSLRLNHETRDISREVGVRLGQSSEFTLLVVAFAASVGFVGTELTSLLQAVTLITFVLSSYLIVNKYPTPISSKATMRKD